MTTPSPAETFRVALATTVDPARHGGVQRNLAMIDEQLRDRDVETSVVWSALFADAAEKKSLRRRVWRRVHPDSEEVHRILRAVTSIGETLRADPFDVVLAFDAWAAIAAVESGLPTVYRTPSLTWAVEEWRRNGYLHGNSATVRRLAAREQAAVRDARGLVTLSEEGRRCFVDLGIAGDRIEVVPNGIDVALWPLGGRTGHAAHTGQPGGVRLVWVGHLRPVKALPDLARAIADLDGPLRQGLSLDVFGAAAFEGNPEHDRSRELLAAAGVPARFPGRVAPERVRATLQGADVFVQASHREGMSNAILEAMAAGLPIVATRVGALPEMLPAESAALLVEPGDIGGLSAALARLIRDPDLRRRLGAANRARVEQHYAADKVGLRYLAALRRAAMSG